jgi:hypothetical protein
LDPFIASVAFASETSIGFTTTREHEDSWQQMSRAMWTGIKEVSALALQTHHPSLTTSNFQNNQASHLHSNILNSTTSQTTPQPTLKMQFKLFTATSILALMAFTSAAPTSVTDPGPAPKSILSPEKCHLVHQNNCYMKGDDGNTLQKRIGCRSTYDGYCYIVSFNDSEAGEQID